MGTQPIKIPIQAIDETQAGFDSAQSSVQQFASETEQQLQQTGQKVSGEFVSVSRVIEEAFRGNVPSVRTLGSAISEIAPHVQTASAAIGDLGVGLKFAFSTAGILAIGAAVAYVADRYIPQLTDALYGFGEAQKKAFEEAGKEYDKFVVKLEKVRDIQRQVLLESLSDPVAKATLSKGFATDDLAEKQRALSILRGQLEAFNDQTNKQRSSGFFGGELYFQKRQEEADKLGVAVANLGIEVDVLAGKADIAGSKLSKAVGDAAAKAAKQLQAELDKVTRALGGIEKQITVALTPKYDLIAQEWGKTIDELRNLAQSKFPEIAAAARSAIPAAMAAMNKELEADTTKLLATLEAEFKKFEADHRTTPFAGGDGTQAQAIADVLKATYKYPSSDLPNLHVTQLGHSLLSLQDITRATTRSFEDMFRGIASGTIAGGNAYKAFARVAVSALTEVVGKMIAVYLTQKLLGLFFPQVGNISPNLPLNQANPLLFASIPKFAGGGDFAGGMPMIVGERGPELMIPKSGGTIIPNGGMGDSYYIDARGSSDPNATAAAVKRAMEISQKKTINSIRQKASRS
jgi:hypothetical protein